MAKHVFITGGSGFVGSAVIRELLQQDYIVHALVNRKGINVTPNHPDQLKVFQGSLFDTNIIESAMAGCDAVIHLVGIIRENAKQGVTFEKIHYEGAKSIIDCAVRVGIKRYIHMSAIGAKAISQSAYQTTKFKAEQHLKSTTLDWTILRPSLILGKEGEFTQMISNWAHGKAAPYFFMPYFGRGFFGQNGANVQPVSVEVVASAFVKCIDLPETIHQTIDLVGPDVMSWKQFYAMMSTQILGKPKLALGLPIWYGKLLTYIVPLSFLPFNYAQVVMAGEDNVGDYPRMRQILG